MDNKMTILQVNQGLQFINESLKQGFPPQNNITYRISIHLNGFLFWSDKYSYELKHGEIKTQIIKVRDRQFSRMSLLPDPGQTRIIKEEPLPFSTSLKRQQLYNGKLINIQLLIDFFNREGVLSSKLVSQILNHGRQIFNMQPNLIHISDPLYIVGDIHGQYYDLVNILNLVGNKAKNNRQKTQIKSKRKFLFLGDYVDRGQFAIQVMILILAMKINDPKKVFVLRGNHESRQLTTYFNFRNQCLQIYNQQIFDQFIYLFYSLPIAAVINNRYLCIHGGISTNMEILQDIMKINRFQQIPQTGLFCDLLWADPVQNQQGKLKKKQLVVVNEIRGCSYNFGYNLTKNILQKNNLHGIIRAHQAKQEGFQMHRWAGHNKFPPVITIFSAPNYCDFYNNKGAIIQIQSNILSIEQISSSSHPFYLPNNLCLFEWTIPFISQKITQLFYILLKPYNQQSAQDPIIAQLIDRQKIIEQLLRLQHEDAEESMEIVRYQGKVLSEQLMNNLDAREYAMNIYNKDFIVEKTIDKINQKRPILQQIPETRPEDQDKLIQNI